MKEAAGRAVTACVRRSTETNRAHDNMTMSGPLLLDPIPGTFQNPLPESSGITYTRNDSLHLTVGAMLVNQAAGRWV